MRCAFDYTSSVIIIRIYIYASGYWTYSHSSGVINIHLNECSAVYSAKGSGLKAFTCFFSLFTPTSVTSPDKVCS